MNNIKQDNLINEQIRFKEVQVIDEEGNKLGKMNTDEAIDLAMDKNLDLVLVSSNPENPVCKWPLSAKITACIFPQYVL